MSQLWNVHCLYLQWLMLYTICSCAGTTKQYCLSYLEAIPRSRRLSPSAASLPNIYKLHFVATLWYPMAHQN